jgi:hypothetical protein
LDIVTNILIFAHNQRGDSGVRVVRLRWDLVALRWPDSQSSEMAASVNLGALRRNAKAGFILTEPTPRGLNHEIHRLD